MSRTTSSDHTMVLGRWLTIHLKKRTPRPTHKEDAVFCPSHVTQSTDDNPIGYHHGTLTFLGWIYFIVGGAYMSFTTVLTLKLCGKNEVNLWHGTIKSYLLGTCWSSWLPGWNLTSDCLDMLVKITQNKGQWRSFLSFLLYSPQTGITWCKHVHAYFDLTRSILLCFLCTT